MLSSDSYGLIIADSGFYEGMKQNSSINELLLWCNYNSIVGGVAHKILQAFIRRIRVILLTCVLLLMLACRMGMIESLWIL